VLNTRQSLSELFQLNRNLTLTLTAETCLHSYIAHSCHFTDRCCTLQKEKHSDNNKVYSCTNCTCIYACDKTSPPRPIKLPSYSSDCPYRHLDIHMHISAATAGEKVTNCHYKRHLLPLFNGHCIFNKNRMSRSIYE